MSFWEIQVVHLHKTHFIRFSLKGSASVINQSKLTWSVVLTFKLKNYFCLVLSFTFIFVHVLKLLYQWKYKLKGKHGNWRVDFLEQDISRKCIMCIFSFFFCLLADAFYFKNRFSWKNANWFLKLFPLE